MTPLEGETLTSGHSLVSFVSVEGMTKQQLRRFFIERPDLRGKIVTEALLRLVPWSMRRRVYERRMVRS